MSGRVSVMTDTFRRPLCTNVRDHYAPPQSVPEVADAGEVKGHARRLSGGDDLLVADRAAWLDDGQDAGLGQHLEPVNERKIRLTSPDRSGRPVPPPPDRYPNR